MANPSNQPLSLIILFLLGSVGIFYLGSTVQNYMDMTLTSLNFDLRAGGVFLDEKRAEITVLIVIDNQHSPRDVKLFTSVALTIWLDEKPISGSYSYTQVIPAGSAILGKWSFGLNDKGIEVCKSLIQNNVPIKIKMTASAILLDFKKMLYVNKVEEVSLQYV